MIKSSTRFEHQDSLNAAKIDSSVEEVYGARIQHTSALLRQAGDAGRRPFEGEAQYEKFFEQLSRALHRPHPRHVLLIREKGVGDHAAICEFTLRAIEGRPGFLTRKEIYSIDCNHVAVPAIGSMLEEIFTSLSQDEDNILFIDAFGLFLKCHGTQDIKSLLNSLAWQARCRIVGLVTPQEYTEFCSTEVDHCGLFTSITLQEPLPPMDKKLVSHFASNLSLKYRTEISQAAIDEAITLTSNFMLHERLPEKAISVLRSICDDVHFDRAQLGLQRNEVTPADVVGKVSELAGLPVETISGLGDQTDYHACISDLVVGQEHAVHEIATELGLIKAGLVDRDKPASVMMFIGQTGTGKTEMAKVLARLYSKTKRLRTFTLGNFSEPHSVSGIIGVPPGYVGHEQGGRLINELNADPYGVFLLDEADKAHPDVMQPFLNLFDEGWICDQRGVKAYANHAIFILTTNVGQRQIGDMCKAEKSADDIRSTMRESLARIRHPKSNRPVFTPEFLARIKRLIVFRSLDLAAMRGICAKVISELQEDWQSKRQKELRVQSDLVELIAQKACEMNEHANGKEGGRIVRKLIAEHIESILMKHIAFEPERYRGCQIVQLRNTLSNDLQDSPVLNLVTVEFISE